MLTYQERSPVNKGMVPAVKKIQLIRRKELEPEKPYKIKVQLSIFMAIAR